MIVQPKILIVDDEPAIRRALQIGLNAQGYFVEEARTGDEAIVAIRRHPVDVVILDLNMPGLGGLETCRRIRALYPRVGIIMNTVRDSEDDRVHAFQAGADDYLGKPFPLRELIARVEAVLRRTRLETRSTGKVLRAGNLEVNLERRSLKRAGHDVHLSPIEFNLLVYLMERPNIPISHATLLRAVWGMEYGGELEYLRTYVRMLRRKIEDDPSKPEYLLTDPWVGYRFHTPAEPASGGPAEEKSQVTRAQS